MILRRRLTVEDRWHLLWGYRAYSMDERWCALWDDGALIICRSWTGIAIFRLVLGDGDVHEIQVNPDIANVGDPTELWHMTHDIVETILDSIVLPVPIPANMIPCGVEGNVRMVEPDCRWSFDLDGEGSLIIAGPGGCFHPV